MTDQSSVDELFARHPDVAVLVNAAGPCPSPEIFAAAGREEGWDARG